MGKQALAQVVASRVTDGAVIGLGSGSTTEVALQAIGARIAAEKLRVYGVATSFRTAAVASEQGLLVLDSRCEVAIDWAFDGADEVDPQLNMIKGRGAAMLMEKIVASRAARLCILVTEDKLVQHLGERFALPIEVLPEAAALAAPAFAALGATEVQLRQAQQKYGELVSEKGNLVYDVRFPQLTLQLQQQLKLIPGVVETGLFWNFRPEVLISTAAGIQVLELVGAQDVATRRAL